MSRQNIAFAFLSSIKRTAAEKYFYTFQQQGYAAKRFCHHQPAVKTPERKKIYELRIYHVHPKDVKRFVEISAEGLEIRKRYSRLLGYWVTEYGGICSQFVHIWEYDSLQERQEKRGKLTLNSDWVKYLNEALTHWHSQESVGLLKLMPWCRLEEPTKDGNIYQLEKIEMNVDLKSDVEKLQEYGQACDPDTGRHLVGAWTSVAGTLNTAYLLFNYNSQDAAVQHHMETNGATAKAYQSLLPLTRSFHSKILVPCMWSPMK